MSVGKFIVFRVSNEFTSKILYFCVSGKRGLKGAAGPVGPMGPQGGQTIPSCVTKFKSRK